MNSKLRLSELFFLLICLLLLSACSGKTQDGQVGKLKISLENMPENFTELDSGVQDYLKIFVTLRSQAKDKYITFELNSESNFSTTVELPFGEYDVKNIGTTAQILEGFEAHSPIENISVTKTNIPHITVFLNDRDLFSQAISINKPTKEILEMDLFSRKFQHNGQIYDMNSIESDMSFSFESKTTVKPSEKISLPSTSHSHVSLIVQNTSSENLYPRDCKTIGIKVTSSSSIFPKGPRVALPISRVANAKNGLLGKPSYCLGNPIRQLDKFMFAYLDSNTGDKITFLCDSSGNNILGILYEFHQYE